VLPELLPLLARLWGLEGESDRRGRWVWDVTHWRTCCTQARAWGLGQQIVRAGHGSGRPSRCQCTVPRRGFAAEFGWTL